MKRKIVWMMLFAVVLGGLLLAEEGITFKVKVSTANVRSKPDASAPVIAKVTAGTVLKVYGKEGAWYEVGVNDKAGEEVFGFIHNTMGEARGEEGEETAEPEPTAETEKPEKVEEKPVVVATREVAKARSAQPAKEIMVVKVKVQMANVRSEPDAAAALVGRVPAGTLLGVTSHAGNWYEVNMNDQSGKAVTGFIRDSVVTVVGADEEEKVEKADEEEYTPSRPSSSRQSISRSGPPASTSMHFGINFGAQTDENFNFDPFLWTAGVELDIQFGNFLMLSPEAILVGSGFEFKEFILYPAAILNLTVSSFFVGGGVAKGFFIGSGASGSTDFLLKLNAGLCAPGVKLTVYALMAFDNLFNDMALGATLGFRF
ncbi:MAG: SH3 domain-containing protein [Candidatus Aminicenantes bacterium]|nr:SH3 domain-containing protein [Candidatus Aminicenantes bacterium]